MSYSVLWESYWNKLIRPQDPRNQTSYYNIQLSERLLKGNLQLSLSVSSRRKKQSQRSVNQPLKRALPFEISTSKQGASAVHFSREHVRDCTTTTE